MKIKVNKKIIIAAAIALIAAISILCIILLSRKNCKIAFYKISPGVQTVLEKQIKNDNKLKIKFYKLNENKPLHSQHPEKYSILFLNNSKPVTSLPVKPIEEAAIKLLPSKIQYSTLKDGQNIALPVLLDHFEFATYSTYQTNAQLNPPRNFEELENYLEKIKEYAQTPLLVIGSDDFELFGFISAMTHSINGAEGYLSVCGKLNKAQAALDDLPYEIIGVLDIIKEWQAKGLIHKNWISASKKDMEFLMQEHHLGSIATFLSTHRTLPYTLVKYYNSNIFPVKYPSIPFGVIAPEICAVKLSELHNEDSILKNLITSKAQTELSKNTQLAPVASVAESNDIISDDVRFYSAATMYGPLPPFSDACFLSKERLHIYAEKIRDYLR